MSVNRALVEMLLCQLPKKIPDGYVPAYEATFAGRHIMILQNQDRVVACDVVADGYRPITPDVNQDEALMVAEAAMGGDQRVMTWPHLERVLALSVVMLCRDKDGPPEAEAPAAVPPSRSPVTPAAAVA